MNETTKTEPAANVRIREGASILHGRAREAGEPGWWRVVIRGERGEWLYQTSQLQFIG